MADRRDILYVVDDVNYKGGAHVATARLVKALVKKGLAVDVLSLSNPTDSARELFAPASIVRAECRIRGWRRIIRSVMSRMGYHVYPAFILDGDGAIRKHMLRYRCVCVMSEMSALRWIVASLPRQVRKVQMLHIDYAFWSQNTSGGRLHSNHDYAIFRRMDSIAVVGKRNAEKLKHLMPRLASRIEWFSNIIPRPRLQSQQRKDSETVGKIRLVTVARIDEGQKDAFRMARIAKRLKTEGLNFVWAVWGEGRILSDLKRSVEVGGYADVFHVEGWTSSPFEKIAEADVFVLLSHYEGLPNVIYESFMCHTPVFSTDVGAIADQISSGENGWLVKDDEESIFAELKRLISTPTQIYEARHRLGSYNYDNDAVVRRHIVLMGLSHDE